MRWRCGSSAWKPSARSPNDCSGVRNSIATCSAAAKREPIAHIKRPEWSATLYDLLSAYAQQRQRHALARVRFAKRTVWSLAEAREALERLIGQSSDWARLDEYLIAFVVEPSMAPTVLASSFASTLELVREGMMEVHQQAAFAPLYVRKRQQAQNGGADPGGVAAPGDSRG